MEQSPAVEANISTTSQEISGLDGKKFHNPWSREVPLIHILVQMNPIDTLPSHV